LVFRTYLWGRNILIAFLESSTANGLISIYLLVLLKVERVPRPRPLGLS
jgi:hypothetical protein